MHDSEPISIALISSAIVLALAAIWFRRKMSGNRAVITFCVILSFVVYPTYSLFIYYGICCDCGWGFRNATLQLFMGTLIVFMTESFLYLKYRKRQVKIGTM